MPGRRRPRRPIFNNTRSSFWSSRQTSNSARQTQSDTQSNMAPSDRSEAIPAPRMRVAEAYEMFKHNTALAMLVVAPILMAIPPRKLDLYTFSLAGAFVASANQLNVERTGKGLISQFGYGPRATQDPFAMTTDQNMSSRRLLEEKSTVPDEVMRRNAGAKGSIEEKAKELWMGGETEGWKERRLKEEQEKLDKGEGYGGMIMDQIWEVWNWGEKKGEELKKKDEAVVEMKNKQREDGS